MIKITPLKVVDYTPTPTVYGLEKVVNGTFSTNTNGWTASAGTIAAVEGGQSGKCLEITAPEQTIVVGETHYHIDGSASVYSDEFDTEIGKVYQLSGYHKAVTNNQNFTVSISPAPIYTYYQSGTAYTTQFYYFSLFFRASAIKTRINLGKQATTESTRGNLLFDTISVREATYNSVNIDSSNVLENDYLGFEMGQTYADGDRCIVTAGVETITLDVAPATAWAVGDLITGQTSGKTARVVKYLTTHTYQIRERTGSFEYHEVIGVTGTPAKLADQGMYYPQVAAPTDQVHKIYESLADGNVGNYPPTDVLATTPKWMEVSATNRWKAFDGRLSDQTENADSIQYVFDLLGPFDSVAIFNLEATSVNVKVVVDTETVYDNTETLIHTEGIGDWYDYFFEPVVQKTEIAMLDIPVYSAGTLTITITNTGATAKCGEIVIGNAQTIGTTLYDINLGITDYSVKSVDSFGHYTITQRAYSSNNIYKIDINNDEVEAVFRALAQDRATPVVWIGHPLHSSLISYGFYKDLSMSVPGIGVSDYTLEIEGLT